MNDLLSISLVKRLCITCGNEQDGEIVLNTELSEKAAKEVAELNGKIIGYTEEPCKECQKLMEKGLLLIGYDEEKSDITKIPEGLYRTGTMSVLKRDSQLAEYFYEKVPSSKTKGFIFVSTQAMDKLKTEL